MPNSFSRFLSDEELRKVRQQYLEELRRAEQAEGDDQEGAGEATPAVEAGAGAESGGERRAEEQRPAGGSAGGEQSTQEGTG
jgi:hypothetical protein